MNRFLLVLQTEKEAISMNGASRPVTATVMAIFAIAGLASSAMARQGQSTDGQQSPPGASAERLTIKTKSCPPVAEPQPIGVNEPGVNMASRSADPGQCDHHPPADAAQRGIDKKDIRRGMVIAKSGSITPHTRQASNAEPAGAGFTPDL